MLQCDHRTRIQWRQETVQAMKVSMQKYSVEENIIDIFCSCITDWLGNSSVDPSKYHYTYNHTISMQNLIDWRHVFMGKLSDRGLVLQPHSNNNHGNKRSNYIQGASFVESSLKSYIELWEQRNKDAHSKQLTQPGNYTNFVIMRNFTILHYFFPTLNNLSKDPQHRNFKDIFS